MRPVARWRWDHEPAHVLHVEGFDTVASRNRWVKAQRESNRQHPDEAQIIVIDVYPPVTGARRDRGRRRPQLQLPYNDENLGPLFAPRGANPDSSGPRREDPSKTALQIAGREFRKAMREGAPPPALVPQHAGRVVQDFAERREARLERMRARAARLERESDASRARRHQIGDRIPMGQPILVGHHSERRHRKDIARIDTLMRKEVESRREAEDVKRRVRAAEAGRGGISSDDPEAVRLLREKLARSQEIHAAILLANKALKQGKDADAAAIMQPYWRDAARQIQIWQSMAHRTIPTTNSSAEIRRIEKRIKELTQRRAEPARTEEVVGDARIDEADNRVRIFFPGKPSGEVRDALKRAGFRWSPTSGAWQRMASHGAWYEARRIVGAPARDPAVRRSSSRERQRAQRRDPEDIIRIEYDAIDNADTRRGGFMPVVWINGHRRGDSYGRGYDHDKAVAIAHAEAREEAARYIGDWQITVRPRSSEPTRDPTTRRQVRGRSRRDPPVRACPVGMRVQSLIFSRIFFDRVGAMNWAVDHGHHASKVDSNGHSHRLRQEDPGRFREGSFRTIDLRPGVKAVVGCPRT